MKFDSTGSAHRSVDGCCKHGILTSSSVSFGEFLDQLSNCQLLKCNSNSRSYNLKRPTISGHGYGTLRGK
jgi:hypothetical protein